MLSKKKSEQLKNSVEEQEKEMKLIQEALQSGNIDILKKNLVFNKNPTKKVVPVVNKVPKSLTQEEIEKREQKKFAKEVDDLVLLQQKLFAQAKRGKAHIQPLKKTKNNLNGTGIYNKDPNKGLVIENKFLKECREVFSKESKEDKKNDISNIGPNPIPKNDSKKSLNTTGFRKTFHKEKIEIDCNTEERMDQKFVKEMSKEEKNFYIENNQSLFEFLQSVNLVRFIEQFISCGIEAKEDILEIDDTFLEMNPFQFLNKTQLNTLFQKINECSGGTKHLTVATGNGEENLDKDKKEQISDEKNFSKINNVSNVGNINNVSNLNNVINPPPL